MHLNWISIYLLISLSFVLGFILCGIFQNHNDRSNELIEEMNRNKKLRETISRFEVLTGGIIMENGEFLSNEDQGL